MQLNPLALALSTAGGSRWTPLNLFFGGIQGLWYDLNDDNTIFQDSAGTTLATWGDPVGRVNDKSGRGNNAIQSTSGSRPIRGRMPKVGRRSLAGRSQEFENALWIKTRSSISANTTTAPDGTLTADKLVEDTSASLSHVINQDVSVLASTTYAGSVYFQASERTWAYINLIHVGIASYRSWFNLSSGAVGISDAGNTATITSVGNGWYRASVSRATAVGQTSIRFEFGLATGDGTVTYTGDGTSGVFIWGAQLETGSTATAYQHVIDSLGFNVTETGQPSCGYLSYNGSNQWMQTAASVNFTATDEMSVFAGVRKVSDAARGQLIEHSVNWTANVGSFSLRAPEDASNRFSYISAGNNLSGAIATTSSATYNAPINVVETGIFDISADSCLLRLNGVQVSSSASDQGTGNYGNYVTYFGARAGTSLFFNGLMFSTIIRGALTSDTLLTRTEQYVARQTPTVNL